MDRSCREKRRGVDQSAVGGLFVNVRVGIKLKAAGKRQRKQQHQTREALVPAHVLPAQQKDREQQHRHKARRDDPDRRAQLKAVVAHDAARRAQKAQVARQHRVAAQLDLIVVCKRKREERHRREKIRRPRPRKEEKAEVDEKKRHEKVHHNEQRQLEVRCPQRLRVDARAGIRRKIEREKADAEAKNREPQEDPQPVRPAHGRAGLLVRAQQRTESLHRKGSTFRSGKNRIIEKYSIFPPKTQRTSAAPLRKVFPRA